MDSQIVYTLLYVFIAYVIAMIVLVTWLMMRNRGKDEINIMYSTGRKKIWRKVNRDGESYTIFNESKKKKLPEWKAVVPSSHAIVPFKARFGRMKLALYIKPYADKFIEFLEDKVAIPILDRESSHKLITLEAWRRYGEGDKQKVSGVMLLILVLLVISLLLNVLIAFKVLKF